MAGGSPHCSSSPSTFRSREVPDSPESPIIPFSHVEPTRTSPTRRVLPDTTMADAPPAFPKPQGGRPQLKTPEPRTSKERINGHRDAVERSPSTPGHLPPFDWEDFEARYEEAFADADRQEQELLKEFEDLVKFFNVWASAASVHDTERGVKRLQTRERYVKIAEQSLSQKKKHREYPLPTHALSSL